MTTNGHDDNESRGTYHSGGEGRGGANWTSTARPTRDSSPAPEHVMSTVPADYKQVPAWGIDMEHQQSYRKELPSDVENVRGPVQEWQIPHDKVHMSVEHPNLTPVFGTSCPPRGLSGSMRDYAYKFGEGTNRHWMTLIFADRVDILESTVIDAFRGHPDRFVQEKGWKANMKYGISPSAQRALTIGSVILGVVAVGALVASVMGDDD